MPEVRDQRFPLDSSVLVELTKAPGVAATQADVQLTDQVFLSLQRVDESAVRIAPGAGPDDEANLDYLLWSIGSREFSGVLIAILPATEGSGRLAERLTTPSGKAMISLQQVHQSAKEFLQHPVENLLATADRYAERRGLAVVVADPPNIEPTSVFEIKIVAPKHAGEDLFQTLIARRNFEFVPVPETTLEKFIDIKAVGEGCGDYGLKLRQIYGEWLHQEFEIEEVAQSALELLNQTFLIPPGKRPPFLPRSWQFTIGAIRLARRMARWALEGDPYRCSVLLVTDEKLQELRSGAHHLLTRVLEIPKSVGFSFHNAGDVREFAELAQADDLFLVVDVNHGTLCDIAVLSKGEYAESRHDRYSGLASSDSLLLHLREGFVELYGKCSLQLWHDGFRWHNQPFKLWEFLADQHFKMEATEKLATIQKLTGAVAALMDQQLSSIIVFLNDMDVDKFKGCIKPDFRQNVAHVSRLDVRNLRVGTLTSLMHLDGAHAITQKGRVLHLAQLIAVSEDTLPLTPSRWPIRGSGTWAARWLSGQLPSSYIIKVSASGYIEFFHEGRSYPLRGMS